MIVSDAIGEKALRLVDEHRVHHLYWLGFEALVSGESGFHRVLAQEDRVWCDCPAWKPDRYCSHAVSAMILWGERVS